MRKLLISIVAAAALVAAVPATAGYAWSIAWLPVYGAACHLSKIFGSAIERDGYRIFLLGYGCDLDAAIRKIVAGSALDVDPATIIAIYHGAQREQSGDEFLAMELVRNSLQEPAGSEMGQSDCAPDGYCGTLGFSRDDFVTKVVRGYLSYAQAQFLFTEKDGADYITSALRMGPLMQAVVFVLYAAAVLAAGRLVVGLVGSPSATGRPPAK